MSHKIAKFLLEHARTFVDRTEAVRTALQLDMPLSEIEKYLDWLDMVQSSKSSSSCDDKATTDGNAEAKS